MGDDYLLGLELIFEDFNKGNNIKLHIQEYREYGYSIVSYFFENLRNKCAIKSINNEIKILSKLK